MTAHLRTLQAHIAFDVFRALSDCAWRMPSRKLNTTEYYQSITVFFSGISSIFALQNSVHLASDKSYFLRIVLNYSASNSYFTLIAPTAFR